MDAILAILAIIGVFIVISYLRGIEKQLDTLKRQVGTLDRPQCRFNPNHRKPKKDDFRNDIQTR